MSVYVQQKKGERERITLSVGLNWVGNVEIFFLEMLGVIARGDEFVGGTSGHEPLK